jgi:hypothetical protein
MRLNTTGPLNFLTAVEKAKSSVLERVVPIRVKSCRKILREILKAHCSWVKVLTFTGT